MRAFTYSRAGDAGAAVQAVSGQGRMPPTMAHAQFLAGGTTLLDLAKLDVMRPSEVIDINDLSTQFGDIRSDARGLHLGAFAHMADVAGHADVLRDYPVVAQSLQLAASAQIRNMATLGGNVLQRTRCSYFRDPTEPQCNKRNPGAGCAALTGVNRKHAVLGTSPNCIASYPGDFAQALIALGADVEIVGASGPHKIHFEDLHVLPGENPQVETVLVPDDLITGFVIPAGAHTRRSLYLKIRDRESYEFAIASAAIALEMDGDRINEARIALGGVASKPWRSREAEAALKGQKLTEDMARDAAAAAFATAATHGENDFKPELGRRTLVRALMQAGAMEI
jgi:xanthine dehydrogenase YagS FAD-binding subunit